jgi:hypothetical protein
MPDSIALSVVLDVREGVVRPRLPVAVVKPPRHRDRTVAIRLDRGLVTQGVLDACCTVEGEGILDYSALVAVAFLGEGPLLLKKIIRNLAASES